MNLMLNALLKLSENEIKNSKIEFNMQAGRGAENFIDRWLKHTETEKSNGICEDCSFWGWYGTKSRNFLPGNIVFSFIRLSNNDEWLLISVAKIIDVPKKSRAKVEIINNYKPLFGRLIIKCNKGNTFSRYVFNLNKYINQSVVKEILPSIYSGEVFEGYDKVNLPFNKLSDIFTDKILPTYKTALDKVKGIYCLTDTHTGKLYIGSATGECGVLQRWYNYFDTKDGGNKKLIALKQKKGVKYFNKFTFTLLEYFSLSYDDEKIKEREQYWKKCLNTIQNGYNAN